ncbi:MAG: hypothetical protein CVT48_00380 [Thermoplasmata archaeon HGW-Thermoplasmata-1]|nr:MAG: hypothetical protein CVT48_00380 [Thermoplasmata archaeon HGW-Thermoplasmata-1]
MNDDRADFKVCHNCYERFAGKGHEGEHCPNCGVSQRDVAAADTQGNRYYGESHLKHGMIPKGIPSNSCGKEAEDRNHGGMKNIKDGRRFSKAGRFLRRLGSMKSVRAVVLALSVYAFLFSIDLMGSGFKAMGGSFTEGLIRGTSDPLTGFFIGLIATAIIQSSSATTSIVVGLVAANPGFMGNAIPIVMGANLGTSITALLVSLGHITRKDEFRRAFSGAVVHDFFKMSAVLILLPAELLARAFFGIGYLQWIASRMAAVFAGSGGGSTFSSPVKAIVEPLRNELMNGIARINSGSLFVGLCSIILALAILFWALKLITSTMRVFTAGKADNFVSKYLFKNGISAFLLGLLLTAVVQSSSVTTSLIIPFAGAGLLSLQQIFTYTIGAAIGTTLTAFLASMATGSIPALTVALVHMMFNITATVVIYPIKPLRKKILQLSEWLGRVASEKKRYVAIFILSTFFIIPIIYILLSNLLR